ncbi:MAG: hypothetical protein KGL74_13010 [Elusimicrobia bacterium]|nr:hypothetical protein [Elusimicrobiota bacterium]
MLLTLAATSARANPSLSDDFGAMSQWLSHEMAQGLAFNAGETFDPPKEVQGYYLQPDISLGVGKIPFDKREFPALQTQALQDEGGSDLFPSSTLFPNLALHLRMGLPWRGDAYVRFADATTPPNYKISPTMTAKVQTNSFGFGIRQHFFGQDDWPTLTVGAHFNHVRGYTNLKGKFTINSNGLTQDDGFTGNIRWNINSYALTAILSHSYGSWTPFAGMGYNYTTGSVSASLDLQASSVNTRVFGAGSDRPEKSQGREIVGVSYDRPTWSFFANGELKALGQLQYRSYIVDAGFALPFDIGRGPKLIYRRLPNGATPKSLRPKRVMIDEDAPAPAEEPAPVPKPKTKSRRRARPESDPGDMIFLK